MLFGTGTVRKLSKTPYLFFDFHGPMVCTATEYLDVRFSRPSTLNPAVYQTGPSYLFMLGSFPLSVLLLGRNLTYKCEYCK